MVDQMVEALPLDGDAEVVHGREVGGAQPARLVNLSEEDFLGRAAERPPAADVPLQRPQLAVAEALGITPVQFLEDGLGLETGIGFEQLADGGPNLVEGVGPGSPAVGQGGFAGPFAELAVLASGFLIHVCPPGRLGQRTAVSQQAEQLLDLLVRDHRNPPCAKKLRIAYERARPGKSNCRRPATVIVVSGVIVVGPGNLIVVSGRNNCR